MRCFPRFCLALILAGLLWLPFNVRADIAPLQVTGGTVAAKSSHERIRMDSEDVTILLGKGSYTVDAVFDFSNSGETTTEWVGFPKGDESFGSERNMPNLPGVPVQTKLPDFIQFHAWVDGKEVPFSEEGKRWLAGKVTFSANAATTIRVVYEADYYRGHYAQYIIGTGSYWKDSIGRAAFTVDGSAIGGTKNFSVGLNAPKSHRLLTDNAVRIEAIDYEPEPKAALRISVSSPKEVFPK